MDNVISSAKTDMFRIRMNPEIREELEQIYAKTGLTLTDAINVFFQQSLNAGGFPFAVTGDNAEIVKAKALARLVKELKKGDDCTESYSAEQARAMLGIAEELNLRKLLLKICGQRNDILGSSLTIRQQQQN